MKERQPRECYSISLGNAWVNISNSKINWPYYLAMDLGFVSFLDMGNRLFAFSNLYRLLHEINSLPM